MEFSGLSISENDLSRNERGSFIMRPVQEWARVVIDCQNLYLSSALESCKQWIEENATGDYEVVEYNHYGFHSDTPTAINKLVFRFESSSDALLFKLSDPTSDPRDMDLAF